MPRLAALAVIIAVAGPAAAAAGAPTSPGLPGSPGVSAPISPYTPPTFHCRVHHYGNGKAPNPIRTKSGKLCVDYNKRDITVDNGGAVRFLEAEPARFAVAGRCRYWQQDHWRIQLDRGYGPIVRWDGSYWWDLERGLGAAIMRHFRIAGQPVGAAQAAAAVDTVSPRLARLIRRYGPRRGGGGGATMRLPRGIPGCH